MPAAHSLIDAIEDIVSAVVGLSEDQIWIEPGGVASIGFHLRHVPGSLERLLTYAEGRPLDDSQLAAIPLEASGDRVPLSRLLEDLRLAGDRTVECYRATAVDTLNEARSVGRAALPSTRLGLLFHAAEHARRHAGQVVATAGIIRGLGLQDRSRE